MPGVPLIARAGQPLHVRTRVQNLSTRPFPAQATYGRRLVRLGAQLCAVDGTIINRDFARAWLPQPLGDSAEQRTGAKRDEERRGETDGRGLVELQIVERDEIEGGRKQQQR